LGITIHDVARHAGVSHTTVSWVVHNDKRISSKTRDKVRRSIKELNYHPNLAARTLVKGKTNTIAILAPFFATPFEQEILRGIEKKQEEKENPFDITLYATKYRDSDVFAEVMYGGKADSAIILSSRLPDNLMEDALSRKFPVVLIEEKDPRTHHIIANNRNGAYQAVEHLILSGRKNIGLIIEKKNDKCALSLWKITGLSIIPVWLSILIFFILMRAL